MTNEILIFWSILFAFFVFPNIVFVDRSHRCLTINRKGFPTGRVRQKNFILGGFVIFLNPLDLFDRVVVAKSFNPLQPRRDYRRALKEIWRLSQLSNKLAVWGYAYFAFLVVECYLSFRIDFNTIAFSLMIGHIGFWFLSVLLVRKILSGKDLYVRKLRTLLLECLFVPANLVSLNKLLLRSVITQIDSMEFQCRYINKFGGGGGETNRVRLLSEINDLLCEEDDPFHLRRLEEMRECLRI